MSGLAWWILAGAGAMLGLGVGLAHWSRRVERPMRAVAERFGGVVSGDGLLRPRRVELTLSGVAVELESRPATTTDAPAVHIRFLWPCAGRLRIRPESRLDAEERRGRGAFADFGDPEFDGRFAVEGQPAPWVREVLDADTRARLRSAAALAGDLAAEVELEWRAGPGGMTLDCRGVDAGDAGRLQCLLLVAQELFARLQAVTPESDEVLARRLETAAGECPVCGDTLAGAVRRCARCRTPHHDECWTYFGGCAVYACACTGSEVARAGS